LLPSPSSALAPTFTRLQTFGVSLLSSLALNDLHSLEDVDDTGHAHVLRRHGHGSRRGRGASDAHFQLGVPAGELAEPLGGLLNEDVPPREWLARQNILILYEFKSKWSLIKTPCLLEVVGFARLPTRIPATSSSEGRHASHLRAMKPVITRTYSLPAGLLILSALEVLSPPLPPPPLSPNHLPFDNHSFSLCLLHFRSRPYSSSSPPSSPPNATPLPPAPPPPPPLPTTTPTRKAAAQKEEARKGAVKRAAWRWRSLRPQSHAQVWPKMPQFRPRFPKFGPQCPNFSPQCPNPAQNAPISATMPRFRPTMLRPSE
jgi:hypothetical protein